MTLGEPDTMHGNDDTPPNGHTRTMTVVPGGDLKTRLEAERIVIKGWVEDAIEEAVGPLAKKMDDVIAAHNASPVKRTFDIAEKLASPAVGLLGMLAVLVVLLWATGLDFDGGGYKIGAAARAANEDSDAVSAGS